MKLLKYALLSLFTSTGSAVMAAPPPVSSPPAPDPLAEALPILQTKYVDFKALNYKPGDHLSDLIARSAGRISLDPPDLTSMPLPIITASLPDGIIYWRLASFALPPGKTWSDLAGQLAVATGTAPGIIFDLRSNTSPDDYAGERQLLGILKPVPMPSKMPQTSEDSRSEPLENPLPIVILTNGQTTGAAEALAASLKADGALVVGRATSGTVAIFTEQKLSTGQILRFVMANVPQADGTPLFGHPVIPDLALSVDDRNEKAALTLIKDNQISEVIQESAERHRLSEAALVHGQDPEYDDYIASLERHPVLLSLPVIHDPVLISALDSLKAIRLSERSLPAEATANATIPSSTSVQ